MGHWDSAGGNGFLSDPYDRAGISGTLMGLAQGLLSQQPGEGVGAALGRGFGLASRGAETAQRGVQHREDRKRSKQYRRKLMAELRDNPDMDPDRRMLIEAIQASPSSNIPAFTMSMLQTMAARQSQELRAQSEAEAAAPDAQREEALRAQWRSMAADEARSPEERAHAEMVSNLDRSQLEQATLQAEQIRGTEQQSEEAALRAQMEFDRTTAIRDSLKRQYQTDLMDEREGRRVARPKGQVEDRWAKELMSLSDSEFQERMRKLNFQQMIVERAMRGDSGGTLQAPGS